MRVLAVLETVAAADRALAVSDLTDILGLPKATAHRLCTMLEREGFLQRELGGRRLAAGPRLSRLAYSVLAGSGERGLRRAVLARLAERVGETCNITLPDGDAMIYFDRVEADWPLRIQLPTGTRVPLHATASGKLYLASLPPAQRRRLIGTLALEKRAVNTITDADLLDRALGEIAGSGVGTDDQELLDGMVAVAVGIHDPTGRLCATLAMHGPNSRLSMAAALSRVGDMRSAARELEAMMTGD